MSQSLFGLRCDFVHRHGLFMALYREDGLRTEELSPMPLKMMQTHAIPRLLAVETEEIDERVKLFYNVTSKRMLSQVLRTEGLGKQQYLQLLLTAAAVLEESKNYMLREGNYVLHEDFIFVGQDVTDLYFTYVPIKDISEPDLRQKFTAFAAQLSKRLRDEELLHIGSILQYCSEELFTVRELKQKLLECLQHKPAVRQGNRMAVSQPEKKRDFMAQIHFKRLELAVLFTCFTLCLLVWRTFLLHSEEAYLYLSVGTTIWAADALFIWVYFFRLSFGGVGTAKTSNIKPQSPQGPPSVLPAAYYRELKNQTTILTAAAPGATVLLHPSTGGIRSAPFLTAQLEVHKEGGVEWIPLRGKSFVIGRGDGNDYVLHIVGVSRSHMEIFQECGAYFAKDLGSRNGTLLNGERMVPFKAYPLANGDCLQIVLSTFTFKIV
jgi:hypothetical protein